MDKWIKVENAPVLKATVYWWQSPYEVRDEEWAYKQLYGNLFYTVEHYQKYHHQEFFSKK